jgi:hypothetical protein
VLLFSIPSRVRFFDVYLDRFILCDTYLYTSKGVELQMLTGEKLSSAMFTSDGRIVLGIF